MNLIVAVDENWGIGKEGQLLVRISGDMKFFRDTTMGKVIVMGRKTFESLPGRKALPGRTNIVLTSNKDYIAEGCKVLTSMGELFGEIHKYNNKDIFLIGGERMYNEYLNYCDTLYITKIYDSFEADKHMVNIDERGGYRITWKGEVNEENGIRYQFFKYERE